MVGRADWVFITVLATFLGIWLIVGARAWSDRVKGPDRGSPGALKPYVGENVVEALGLDRSVPIDGYSMRRGNSTGSYYSVCEDPQGGAALWLLSIEFELPHVVFYSLDDETSQKTGFPLASENRLTATKDSEEAEELRRYAARRNLKGI